MSVHPSRDTLPAALVFPVGQAVHETVPILPENEPGFCQVAEPNAEDKVPGSHKEHTEEPTGALVPIISTGAFGAVG
jgi:hypothetical protein